MKATPSGSSDPPAGGSKTPRLSRDSSSPVVLRSRIPVVPMENLGSFSWNKLLEFSEHQKEVEPPARARSRPGGGV